MQRRSRVNSGNKIVTLTYLCCIGVCLATGPAANVHSLLDLSDRIVLSLSLVLKCGRNLLGFTMDRDNSANFRLGVLCNCFAAADATVTRVAPAGPSTIPLCCWLCRIVITITQPLCMNMSRIVATSRCIRAGNA